MSDVVTDTHGLIWYLQDDRRLGPGARAVFEACDRGELTIYVPTICLVEIAYLQEKGRIPLDFRTRLEVVLGSNSSGLVPADLTLGVVGSIGLIPRTDVPDMPDRIIAATALHLGLPLISRDASIKQSSVVTIW